MGQPGELLDDDHRPVLAGRAAGGVRTCQLQQEISSRLLRGMGKVGGSPRSPRHRGTCLPPGTGRGPAFWHG